MPSGNWIFYTVIVKFWTGFTASVLWKVEANSARFFILFCLFVFLIFLRDQISVWSAEKWICLLSPSWSHLFVVKELNILGTTGHCKQRCYSWFVSSLIPYTSWLHQLGTDCTLYNNSEYSCVQYHFNVKWFSIVSPLNNCISKLSSKIIFPM